MAEIKYQPVPHNHDAFLKKARKRRGFQAAYEALAVEDEAGPRKRPLPEKTSVRG